MNQAGYLFRLQRIDTQLDNARNRLAEIDHLLLEDERLRLAQEDAAQKRNFMEKCRQKVRNLEHAVGEVQVKIEISNSSLYSGRVKNPKELQDLEKEIVSLRKHLKTLEDEQLEAMIEFETAEQDFQKAQARLTTVQAQVIQEKAGLAGERDSLNQKVANLDAERMAAIPSILPDILTIYQKIRESKKGTAVTSVEDNACVTCGGEIRMSEAQASRSQSALIYCQSCGRIIFAG